MLTPVRLRGSELRVGDRLGSRDQEEDHRAPTDRRPR